MTHCKRILSFLAIVAVIFPAQAKALEETTNSLVRFHFLGSSALAGGTNGTRLKQVLDLPASQQFGAQLLQKMADDAGQAVSKENATNQSALIRPLLDDLMKNESLGEWRFEGSHEFVLGVQLNEARWALWQSNLLQLATGWTGEKALMNQDGWVLATKDSKKAILSHSGKWTIFSFEKGQSNLRTEFAKKLEQKQPNLFAATNWLEADINWPALQRWFPTTKFPLKSARTEIAVSTKGENLRTTVRAIYPEKLNWNFQAWQIPSNTIRDPLISFTVAQPLAPIFNEPSLLQKIGINPLTNQLYWWAQSGIPFQTFAATPQQNATNRLLEMSKQLPAAMNPLLKERLAGGEISWDTNRNRMVWKGLAIVAPNLHAIREKSGEYLMGELFPPAPSTNPPPTELFAQFQGNPKVIYYDWEITQERLGNWQMLSKMLPFSAKRPQAVANPAPPTSGLSLGTPVKHPDTNAAPQKLIPGRGRFAHQQWQNAIGPLLGNTITEVTVTGDNELTLVRKSHIGFTGLELVFLSEWLNSPDFHFFGSNKTIPAKAP